jgi:hypothetical protein
VPLVICVSTRFGRGFDRRVSSWLKVFWRDDVDAQMKFLLEMLKEGFYGQATT